MSVREMIQELIKLLYQKAVEKRYRMMSKYGDLCVCYILSSVGYYRVWQRSSIPPNTWREARASGCQHSSVTARKCRSAPCGFFDINSGLW